LVDFHGWQPLISRECPFVSAYLLQNEEGRAHMWFNLATASGHERGSENRDNVAEKMTSDQIAEAQRMAREMVEANPKLMGE